MFLVKEYEHFFSILMVYFCYNSVDFTESEFNESDFIESDLTESQSDELLLETSLQRSFNVKHTC